MSNDLKNKITQAYKLAEAAGQQGLIPYLQHLTIDCRPEPRPAREVYESWQWALAQRYAPLFENVCGVRGSFSGPYNLWLGMPKGHNKTTSTGQAISYALAFARRSWRGYCYAEDRDQAGLLLEAMLGEYRLNPWLKKRLTFKNWDVSGPNGCLLTIESADAASSHGIRPDLIICDEICNWSDEDMFKSLVTSMRKKRGCGFVVLTNAGIKHTWQWNAREIARQSPRWFWYEAPGRLASWMDEDAIKDDRALLPPALAARLFDNVWMDPGEECGFVTRSEAEACSALGRSRNLRIQSEGCSNRQYFGAIDFGSVKDRCVCVICHLEAPPQSTPGNDQQSLVIIDRMDVRQGSRLNPVPVQWVRDWLDTYRKLFRFQKIVVDPYQLQGVIEDYSPHVPIETWKARGGQGNFDMAQTLRSLLVNKHIAWPHSCGDILLGGRPHTFVDELAELIVKPYSNGTSYRVDHLPSKFDDRTVACMMACSAAVKSERLKQLYVGDDDSLWW